MSSFPRTAALFTSATIVVLACDDAPVTTPVQNLPPLAAATFHVHESDGQVLPALLAHRTVGGVLEQDYLDSARVLVHANGTWEQHGWVQRYRGGVKVGDATSFERGTWHAEPTRYVFTALGSGPAFTLPAAPDEELQLLLRYPGFEGLANSRLRRSTPLPGVVGEWRATGLAGQALPATIYHEPRFFDGERWASAHVRVDSAFMSVQPTGRYRHRIFVTEWHGEPHGPPTRIFHRTLYSDFGAWKRDGGAISFESAWLQNHRIQGDVGMVASHRITLFHGLSHGDEPTGFTYSRR